MTNMIIEVIDKTMQAKESVVAITITSFDYVLTFVWVFCLLKVQKLNLSLTLALYYTKATRSSVGLVSCPFEILILRMACSWNLHQSYLLKKMLFSDIISFGIISADICRNWKVEKSVVFFFQVNLLLK